jgi:hypothetical protein
MNKCLVVILLVTALSLGFIAGTNVAAYFWGRQSTAGIRAHALANVSTSWAALSALREGQTNRVITILELQLDSGIGTLASSRKMMDWNSLVTNASLIRAKQYKDRYSSGETIPEVRQFMIEIKSSDGERVKGRDPARDR